MRQDHQRHGQNRGQQRGRNKNRSQNLAQRTLDSNGPDIKLRGTAAHICKKYQTLARDAQSTGDRIRAENYLQHADHYYRLVMAAQQQSAQQQPQQAQQHNASEASPEHSPSAYQDEDGYKNSAKNGSGNFENTARSDTARSDTARSDTARSETASSEATSSEAMDDETSGGENGADH